MTALPAGFDPTDPDLGEQRVPLQEFLELRKTAPVWWVEQKPEARAGFLDTGYWACTRHEEVRQVSKDNENWSAMENGVIIRFAPDMTRDQVEVQRAMLIHHDPPDHTQMRGIVSRASAEYLVDLRDENFIVRLTLHVQNLVARAHEKTYSRNPLTRSIKSSYPMIYELAVYIASRLQSAEGIEVNDDEIAYIAMHVGAYRSSSRGGGTRSPAPSSARTTTTCTSCSASAWRARSATSWTSPA